VSALKDQKEKKVFGDILARFPMKPKLDWVRSKIEALQAQKVNEGHPRNREPDDCGDLRLDSTSAQRVRTPARDATFTHKR